MSTPINLNKERKARLRAENKLRADRNAVKFGRTKAEKAQSQQQMETEARRLEDHKREP